MFPLFQKWMAYARTDLGERTAREYGYWVGWRFLLDFGATPFECTHDDIIRFIGGIGGRGAARSVAKQALRHLFRYLHATGQRTDNPAALLPRNRRSRHAPDWFTEDELARFIYTAACWCPEWAWAFLFIYATGASVGEGCGLAPDELDLEARVVIFRRTKNGLDRVVPLGPTAYAAARWLASRNGTSTILSVSPSAIRGRMLRVCEMADLPRRKAHPHVLRHSIGTALCAHGVHQREVQAFLGHIDPAMTSWYEHVSGDRMRLVAESI